MANVQKVDLVNIDLNTGNIHRSFFSHAIGLKDEKGDGFGVRVFRDGEPVNLTGVSIQGVFMPPQGNPIAITSGNVVDYNEAYVVLPSNCYDYEGQFTLAIKLVDPANVVKGTMRIVDGIVSNTHAVGTVAPTAFIPTYEDVLATYEQAIAAINKTVRFDAVQSLTDTQKATARSNISAPSVADLTAEATTRAAADTAINNAIGTVPSGKTVQGQIDTLESGKVPKTTTVNGHALSANVTVTKGDVGLGNVDNTSDVNKPVSTAQQAAIDAEAATRAAADADLKSALSIITDGELLTGWQTGKRIATNVTTVAYGTPSSNSGWDCIVADCNEGDIFTLSGSSTSSVYALWCWCKTDGTKVLAASTTFTYDKVEIKAPANAKKLIVNSANNVEHFLVAGRIIGTNMDSIYAGDDNVVNLFSYIKKENESETGYSLTWNTKETGCAVVANLSSLKTIYLYRNATKLPNGMKAGGKYRLILQSENVELRMFWYDASGGSTTIFTKKGFNNDVFTIPAEAIGLAVTLRIPANTEVDETVYTFIYQENSDIEKFAFTQSMVLQNKNEEENLILTMNPKGKTTETISYTWDLVDMSCTVIGNISSSSYCDIFRDVTAMPSSMVPGGSYVVACDSDIVKLRFIWYDSNGDDYLLAMTKGKDPIAITIPSEAVGLTIRLYISTTGVNINEKVYSYIFNALTDFDKKLSKERLGIGNTQGNENAHLIAVGNSFMSGAVWIGGHSDHSYSEYNNSVYGNIATALSVPQVNVDFTLHSSCGIIKKNDDKNLLDIIKTKDLSEYDYLLTMISGSDMAYGIGDINATADDGTIAGAVVSLISYATTSNGMCKVILLSVPPYSSDIDKSGANTFTGLYSNDKSLTELDELMYALAKKYHFTFISWQDNPMSYHYMDFADYIGPNEGSRHANSEDTYRAMGEYAAMQMMAVNSPIALKMIAGLS